VSIVSVVVVTTLPDTKFTQLVGAARVVAAVVTKGSRCGRFRTLETDWHSEMFTRAAISRLGRRREWNRLATFSKNVGPLDAAMGNTVSWKGHCLDNHDHLTSSFCFRALSAGPPLPQREQDKTTAWKNVLVQLRTIPNLITLGRIVVSPYIAYLILVPHDYTTALAVSAVAAVSDGVDGWIAKSWPATQQTVLGTYLDPLADKVFVNTVALSLYAATPLLPTHMVLAWCVKDVVLMAATYHYVAARTPAGQAVMDPVATPLHVTPTLISKVNTVWQFVVLVVAMGTAVATDGSVVMAAAEAASTAVVAGEAASWMPSWREAATAQAPTVLPILCTISTVTTVASMASYLDFSAMKRRR
jgi:cardiolipin synthase (CMP-forming)